MATGRKETAEALKKRAVYLEKRIREREDVGLSAAHEREELGALNYVFRLFEENPVVPDKQVSEALSRYKIDITAQREMFFDELVSDMGLLRKFSRSGMGYEQCAARLIVNFINNRLQEK